MADKRDMAGRDNCPCLTILGYFLYSLFKAGYAVDE